MVNKLLVPPSYELEKNHIDALIKTLDLFSGDFNVVVDEQHMNSFRDSYSLKNLIKQPICYKNPNNSTSISLILTDVPKSFQSTCVLEIRLSNFHLITFAVM